MEMTATIWCSDDLRVKKKTKDKKETRTVQCVAVLVSFILVDVLHPAIFQ